MERLHNKLLKITMVLCLSIFSAASLFAQPVVTFELEGSGDDDYIGCQPYLVTFKGRVTNLGTLTIDSANAILGNGQTVGDDEWTVGGNPYEISTSLDAGTYNPTFIVYFSDGSEIRRALPRQLVIYSLPQADFRIDGDAVQCFADNEFFFKDLSKESAEGHKIVKWGWDFGDGYFGPENKQQNPSHQYESSGFFDIILTVEDEEGCVSTEIKNDLPEVYPEIGAKFRVNGPIGCPCGDIRFFNQTKIDFDKVDKWVWDWGVRKKRDTFYASNPAHVDTAWTDFTREYCVDGYHSPMLVVWTKDGCKDSITLVDAIRNIDVQFDITWVPDTPCFQDNGISFFMKPRPNATYFVWTFGDPASMQLNTDDESWKPTHNFEGGAGFYNITLEILEPPCGWFDTTICYVKLKGPAAAINLPAPPFGNNCVDPEEIPYRDFERIKYDECYRGNTGTTGIEYMPISTNRRVKDSTFFYCNADIDSTKTIDWWEPNAKDAAADGSIGCPSDTSVDTPKKTFYFYEDPDEGVNGSWYYRYMNWTNRQLNPGVWTYTDDIPVEYSLDVVDTFALIRDVMFRIDTVSKNGKTGVRLDSIFFDVTDTAFTNRFDSQLIERVFVLEGKHQAFRKGGIGEIDFPRTVYYKVGDFYYTNELIDVSGSGGVGDSIFWTFNGGSKTAQKPATLRLYSPYLRGHKAWTGGRLYFARPESPITYRRDNGTLGKYVPLMSPGTDPLLGDCGDDWETMHDSDKVKPDCAAPNLVSFTNNTTKYRLFGRGGASVPPHKLYSWDNLPGKFVPSDVIDVCSDRANMSNPNFPWATDSLYYLWDFGDDGDQCTTYYDANRNIRVKGQNPSGDPLRCLNSELPTPQHLYTSDGCYTATLNVFDSVTNCAAEATQTIIMEQPDAGPADPRGPLYGVEDVNYYNQPVFQKDEDNEDFRKGMVLGRGAPPCVGNASNRYFQRIDVSETLPSCGRETFWMIFNREDDCQLIHCDSLTREILEVGSGHNPGEYDVRFIPYDNDGNRLSFGQPIRGKIFIGDDSSLVHYQVTEKGEDYPNEFIGKAVFNDSSSLGFDPTRDDSIILTVTQEMRRTININDRGLNLRPGQYSVQFVPVDPVTDTAEGYVVIGDSGILTEVQVTDYGSGYPVTSVSTLKITQNVPALDPNLRDQFGDVLKVFPDVSLNSNWKTTNSYYECGWIPELVLVLLGMQWSYTSPGCKTPGVVIKAGDCLDTFFYEGYRYFLDANADALMSPNPQTYMIEEATLGGARRSKEFIDQILERSHDTCDFNRRNTTALAQKLPYPITFSANDLMRNDPLDPGEDSVCDAADSLRNFIFTIQQIRNTCGTRTNTITRFDSFEMNTAVPDTAASVDTVWDYSNGLLKVSLKDSKVVRFFDPELVNLRDTIYQVFKEPGKYTVATTAKAKHGRAFCFGGGLREFWIGQFQCYRYSDDVVCGEQDIEFIDSVRYWKQPGSIFCELTLDPASPYYPGNNPFCVDTGRYFYKPFWTRKKWTADPTYSLPNDLEEIAYDFNAPRFNDNGDRIQEHERVMDPALIDVWDSVDKVTGVRDSQVIWNYAENGLGVGVYDVTLWAKDSMGCWTPYTVKNAVRVVGVEARFNRCPNCREIMVCTPAGAIFRDTSVIFEDPSIVPGGESVTVGQEDQIVKWTWEFGDGRDNSTLQHPLHNYLDPGTYDVKLKVETEQGCVDSLLKPDYVTVIAAKAKFNLLTEEICVGSEVTIQDSSFGFKDGSGTWTWNKGDSSAPYNSQGEEIVKFRYNKPGTYNISLRVSGKIDDPVTGSEATCEDEYPHPIYDDGLKITVVVRPTDSIEIAPFDTLICPNEEVTFGLDRDISSPAYDSLVWHLGLEGSDSIRTSTTEELKQVFTDDGTYKIYLTGFGEWPICPGADSGTVTVKNVEANVAIDSAISNFDLGNYTFLNNSVNGVEYTWEIYEMPTKTLIYTDTRNDKSSLEYNEFIEGDYMIVLTAVDDPDPSKACVDADTVEVNVNPIFKIYNVFSPNNDGKNDFFEIELQASPEYRLKIFNRWGEVIFEGTQEDAIDCYMDDAKGNQVCKFWDGNNHRTGAPAPAGTYYYIFEYRFKGDEELETVNGTITLLR